MKFYHLKTDKILCSIRSANGSFPVLNLTLKSWQAQYILACGGELHDVGSFAEIQTNEPHFVFEEDYTAG